MKVLVGAFAMITNLRVKCEPSFEALVEAGSVECVELLAGEEGVEWNEKNLVGKTPLLTAMRENNTDMVKTLLKIPGVDITVKDRHGKCLLKLAAEKNNLHSAACEDL